MQYQEQGIARSEVLSMIKRNYEFCLIFILPNLDSRLFKIKQIASQMDIDQKTREYFFQLLFESKLWTLNGRTVRCHFDLLDLGDISTSEFLSMTVAIISRLRKEPVCEYETMSLVTSQELVKDFMKTVKKGFGELYKKSKDPNLDKDCVFSWVHTGILEYQQKSQSADF